MRLALLAFAVVAVSARAETPKDSVEMYTEVVTCQTVSQVQTNSEAPTSNIRNTVTTRQGWRLGALDVRNSVTQVFSVEDGVQEPYWTSMQHVASTKSIEGDLETEVTDTYRSSQLLNEGVNSDSKIRTKQFKTTSTWKRLSKQQRIHVKSVVEGSDDDTRQILETETSVSPTIRVVISELQAPYEEKLGDMTVKTLNSRTTCTIERK